jgi:hypothetical protein
VNSPSWLWTQEMGFGYWASQVFTKCIAIWLDVLLSRQTIPSTQTAFVRSPTAGRANVLPTPYNGPGSHYRCQGPRCGRRVGGPPGPPVPCTATAFCTLCSGRCRYPEGQQEQQSTSIVRRTWILQHKNALEHQNQHACVPSGQSPCNLRIPSRRCGSRPHRAGRNESSENRDTKRPSPCGYIDIGSALRRYRAESCRNSTRLSLRAALR